MGGIISGVTDAIGLTDSKAGQRSADASIAAAEIAAQSQQEALDYLKQQEALPTEIRDEALRNLQQQFLGGGDIFQRPDQAALVQQAQSSPIYNAMIGSQQAGEEAIMRNQAMTGGLRSGNTQSAMYDYNTQLQNQALLQGYNQALAEQQYGNQLTGQELSGIQGLAQLPSNANQIAGLTAGIGQTMAQGQTAAAQAQAAGNAANSANLAGLANMGLGAYALFSDRRLKENIQLQGVKNGHKWYSWDWNDKAKGLGLSGSSEGVMADEIAQTNPDAVEYDGQYMKVNYQALGV